WYFGATRTAPVASNAPTAAEATHLSIVVLPFANLSNDPSQDYFADGITENLTTDLSRLSGSFVIARNTAFAFKGKNVDAREIGKELGVRYVLEGSGQRPAHRRRERRSSLGRSLRQTSRRPVRHAGRNCRQPRQPIGGGVGRERGPARGTGPQPRFDGPLFSGVGLVQ